MTQPIHFFKMSGSGNDFIIIDNISQQVPTSILPRLIRGTCRRKMSVGADGLILIETAEDCDFKWRFFNSDGSVAEMCGNGARCAARFAFLNKIAGSEMSFETDAGVVTAKVSGDRVRIKMTDPEDAAFDYPLTLQSGIQTVSSINTGVPHVVIPTEDIDAVDVSAMGREIRYHERFAPAGTNVNFVMPAADGRVAIRTYERGVENETLACGTGSVAGALVMAHLSGASSPIDMLTRGGGILTIFFKGQAGNFSEVYMEGDARVIYTGQLWDEAWQDL